MVKVLFKYEVLFIFQFFYIFLLSILPINGFTLKNIIFITISLLMIAAYIQLYITSRKLENKDYIVSSSNDLTYLFIIESLYIISILSFIDFQSVNVGLVDFILIGISLIIFHKMNEFRHFLDLRLFLDFHFNVNKMLKK